MKKITILIVAILIGLSNVNYASEIRPKIRQGLFLPNLVGRCLLINGSRVIEDSRIPENAIVIFNKVNPDDTNGNFDIIVSQPSAGKIVFHSVSGQNAVGTVGPVINFLVFSPKNAIDDLD